MRKKDQKKILTCGILAFLLVFLCSSIGCKKIAALVTDLVIDNQCGVAVDIFMDGTYLFSIEYLENKTAEDVAQGSHFLEAKKRGTGIIVASITQEVVGGGNLLWIVETSASITVTNEFGEELRIYANGTYIGNLADKQSDTVANVIYATHQFDANKASDNTNVASHTFNVVDNIEYTWTIRK
jgi:hypothetical protein